jgi:site-specific recombinase XerD
MVGDMTTPERTILPAADGRPDWLPITTGTGLTASADPYAVYLDNLGSPNSKRGMRGCLDNIARMIIRDATGTEPDPHEVGGAGCPWWLFRYQHAARVRALLLDPEVGYSPASVNVHLSALRGVMKESWHLGLMSGDDYARAKEIKSVKGKRELTGRSVTKDEVAKMLAAAKAAKAPVCYRDAALITLLESTGLRCNEIAGALIERYDAAERSLRVIGKGNKERTVWINREVVPVLEKWLTFLDERRGPIFRSIDKHGVISEDGLCLSGVWYLIDDIRKRAGVKKLSTHDFRRTYAGEFMDAGGDVLQAADTMGHDDPMTTKRYDRRDGRAIRDVVDRIKIVVPASPVE